MVRPFRGETERYGDYSKAGEYVYDHPFLWGSKRTGPDLHRVGGKYLDSWHCYHMNEPQSMSSGSIMPSYPWLISQSVDFSGTSAKIRAMRKLGVPYAEQSDQNIQDSARKQGKRIAASLAKEASKPCLIRK